MKRLHSGFTLIEVMITVVIIGILAAIAYPSYQQYVLRGNRSEAMALLNEAAAREERYFAQNNAYVTDQNAIGDLKLRNTSGNIVTSDTGKYQLRVSAPTDSGGYLLTATPQGVQAKDTQCANFTLDATGTKGVSGTGSVSECWK